MGKTFRDSTVKKIEGRQKKQEQASAREQAELDRKEAEEQAKWSQGSKKPHSKKLEEEEKRQAKQQAKKERDEIAAREEEEIKNEGKAKKPN